MDVSFSSLKDYKQRRPSQELVAEDLHGVEWRFQHIYRGNFYIILWCGMV